MNVFQTASILLPRETSYQKWSVVACDQYASEPRYWKRVRRNTEGYRSVMHMILPDAELNNPRVSDSIRYVNETMEWYLRDGVFRSFDNAYVYVERRLTNGMVRSGLIGKIDLEAYDYHEGSTSVIRPSEKIVEERIAPRVQIRRDARLEFPHVQLLCDDQQKQLIEPFAVIRDLLPVVYDFDLMEQGGHVTGWLVQGEWAAEFDRRLTEYAAHYSEKYPEIPGVPALFMVGEGNLSLATAKSCYEELKASDPGRDFTGHPARYALVELENLWDPSLHVERVHRVVTDTDAKKLLTEIRRISVPGGFPVRWNIGPELGMLYLDRSRGSRAIGILQDFLDDYLSRNEGKLDYIVGATNLEEWSSQKNAIGFLLPDSHKEYMFPEIIAGGVFPRKSFDLCHPNEMRYYLEGRIIK